MNLKFSQFGSDLPHEGQLSSITYAPANHGEQETSFPPTAGGNPVPTGPYTDTLGDLSGTDPRGTWQLYIVDDANQRSGSMSGSWCLILNP